MRLFFVLVGTRTRPSKLLTSFCKCVVFFFFFNQRLNQVVMETEAVSLSGSSAGLIIREHG